MLNNESNVKLLSDTFVNMLKDKMSVADFEKMQELNKAETNKRICHSHDFTDANAVMLSAFEKCFSDTTFDFDNGDHINLFNAAWNLAKNARDI